MKIKKTTLYPINDLEILLVPDDDSAEIKYITQKAKKIK